MSGGHSSDRPWNFNATHCTPIALSPFLSSFSLQPFLAPTTARLPVYPWLWQPTNKSLNRTHCTPWDSQSCLSTFAIRFSLVFWWFPQKLSLLSGGKFIAYFPIPVTGYFFLQFVAMLCVTRGSQVYFSKSKSNRNRQGRQHTFFEYPVIGVFD